MKNWTIKVKLLTSKKLAERSWNQQSLPNTVKYCEKCCETRASGIKLNTLRFIIHLGNLLPFGWLWFLFSEKVIQYKFKHFIEFLGFVGGWAFIMSMVGF